MSSKPGEFSFSISHLWPKMNQISELHSMCWRHNSPWWISFWLMNWWNGPLMYMTLEKCPIFFISLSFIFPLFPLQPWSESVTGIWQWSRKLNLGKNCSIRFPLLLQMAKSIYKDKRFVLGSWFLILSSWSFCIVVLWPIKKIKGYMEKKTAHLTSVRKQKQKEKFWGPNISFRDTFAVN